MKKANLYQTEKHDKDHILRSLRAAYAGQIFSELNRFVGSADRNTIEGVLENVYARLPEISSECDVSLLVTACIRSAAGLDASVPKITEVEASCEKSLVAIGGRIGRRHRRIAKYAIPISCVLLLIALLLLYFFPPF